MESEDDEFGNENNEEDIERQTQRQVFSTPLSPNNKLSLRGRSKIDLLDTSHTAFAAFSLGRQNCTAIHQKCIPAVRKNCCTAVRYLSNNTSAMGTPLQLSISFLSLPFPH